MSTRYEVIYQYYDSGKLQSAKLLYSGQNLREVRSLAQEEVSDLGKESHGNL